MVVTASAHGLCRGCSRSLAAHGGRLNGLCDGCSLLTRRYPGRDLATLRNGRTEVLPQERPINNRRWRDEASCQSAPPELFECRTKPGSSTVPKETVQAAVVFCRVCPVIEQCRREADEHRYEGLWGGVFRRRPTAAGAKRYEVRNLL